MVVSNLWTLSEIYRSYNIVCLWIVCNFSIFNLENTMVRAINSNVFLSVVGNVPIYAVDNMTVREKRNLVTQFYSLEVM